MTDFRFQTLILGTGNVSMPIIQPSGSILQNFGLFKKLSGIQTWGVTQRTGYVSSTKATEYDTLMTNSCDSDHEDVQDIGPEEGPNGPIIYV